MKANITCSNYSLIKGANSDCQETWNQLDSKQSGANSVLPKNLLELQKMDTGLSATNVGKVNVRNEDDREEQEPVAPQEGKPQLP